MGEIEIGMASISHSLVGTSASEFLRSSSNGVNGIPLRTLGRARFGSMTRRDLVVAAKIRKVKKQDHPWPDDPDPNVKGGVLTHLSYFKPLPEDQKLKPVTLEFKKRLLSLEKKITDVRNMANKTGLDFSDQLFTLESNYQQMMETLNQERLVEYLKELQLKEDTNDYYAATLGGETLTRNPHLDRE
nr:acetyl-coenzyme A carboxylase carboxyl transferase subunit alpha, chloroplastic-like [Quercus suber]